MEKCVVGDLWEIYDKDEFSSKKHWHKELEFAYLISGRLQINVDDVIRDLTEGELFIISGGAVHYYIDKEHEFEVGVVKISLQLFDGLSRDVKEFLAGLYEEVLHIDQSEEVRRIFMDIVGLITEREKIVQEMVLMARMIELSLYLSAHGSLVKNHMEYKKNSDAELMERMTAYFLDHCNEKVTLADMASHLGFSESYCSKYIKKKTSMNFLEYLNSSRIMRAETLLRTTEKSVTEIAYSIGFSSIQSFNRVFKASCGESPSDYRKRLRDKKQDILDKK